MKVFRHSSGLPNLTTRTPRVIKSLVTPGGSTELKEIPVYTGDNMVGIAQMAKSNAIPVFNFEHIKDIGHMRR